MGNFYDDHILPRKILAGGCHLNRELPKLIEAAGFRIDRLDQRYHPGPRFMTYLYTGSASRG